MANTQPAFAPAGKVVQCTKIIFKCCPLCFLKQEFAARAILLKRYLYSY